MGCCGTTKRTAAITYPKKPFVVNWKKKLPVVNFVHAATGTIKIIGYFTKE